VVGDWLSAGTSRLVTLFLGTTVSLSSWEELYQEVVHGRKATRPLSIPFPVCYCANEQTSADNGPDWLETTTNSVSFSSVLPPIAVVYLQFELRRL